LVSLRAVDVVACNALGQDQEKLGPQCVSEVEVEAQGVKFKRGLLHKVEPKGILHAISHKFYYLPDSFCKVNDIIMTSC